MDGFPINIRPKNFAITGFAPSGRVTIFFNQQP
jgi:hypothetical protein